MKVLCVDGERQEEITFKVWNSHDTYKVILRAGDALVGALEPFELPVTGALRWHQRVACSCMHTRGRAYPCDHGGQCLVFIKHHVDAYNDANRGGGGRMLQVPPELWYPKLAKWFGPEFHLRRIAQSLEGLTAVVPPDAGSAQLWPWNITQRAHRRVTRYRNGHREGAARSDAGDEGGADGACGANDLLAPPEGWGRDSDGGRENDGSSEVRKEAAKRKQAKKVTCSGCGLTGHNALRCTEKQPCRMVENSQILKELAKLPVLPLDTWQKLQTLPGSASPAHVEPEQGAGTRAHRGHVRGVDLRAWFDLNDSVQRQLEAEDTYVPFAGDAHDADGEDVNVAEGDDGDANDVGDDVASPARVRQRQVVAARQDGRGDEPGGRADVVGGGHRGVVGGVSVLALFRGGAVDR